MIALLLLGICPNIPLFDNAGPVCSPAAQVEECRCSECFVWNPSQETSSDPIVDWYDVERTNPDGSFGVVGGTWRENWIDPDTGNPYTAPPSTVWCFAKDSPIPSEGQLYAYRVRACSTANGCSSYDLPVEYTAAPYAINQFRPPVQGN